VYREVCVSGIRSSVVCITDKHRDAHTDSLIANLRYPLTARRRTSAALIKVDAASPRIIADEFTALSRYLDWRCVYMSLGNPEMATDERRQPTSAQHFRTTVTSSGRDVIPAKRGGGL